MECLSQRFKEEVTSLLDSPRSVIATIAMKGKGFIQQIRQRTDCRLVTVTVDNRDRLTDELMTEVLESLQPPKGEQSP